MPPCQRLLEDPKLILVKDKSLHNRNVILIKFIKIYEMQIPNLTRLKETASKKVLTACFVCEYRLAQHAFYDFQAFFIKYAYRVDCCGWHHFRNRYRCRSRCRYIMVSECSGSINHFWLSLSFKQRWIRQPQWPLYQASKYWCIIKEL